MRAAVAMGADIDDEGAGRHLHLIDAEQEQHVERVRRKHRRRVQAAVARHEADIERAGERCLAVQDVEAVPAVLDDAERGRRLRRHRQHGGAVGTVERALPDDEHRLFLVGGRVIDELRQALRPGAEIVVGISEVGLLADEAEQHIALR